MPTGQWDYRGQEGPSPFVNDSAVALFNVPPRETWQLLSLWAEYTTTATAGVRALRLVIRDLADDVVFEVSAGVTLGVSTDADFLFAPGVADLTAVRDSDSVTVPIPAGILLEPGWDINIEVGNADSVDDSDATSDLDLMVTQLMYASRNVLSSGLESAQSSDQPANTDSDLS
jgi:hypothetical protein